MFMDHRSVCKFGVSIDNIYLNILILVFDSLFKLKDDSFRPWPNLPTSPG